MKTIYLFSLQPAFGLVKGWHLERGRNSRKLISRTQGMFPGVQTHFPGPEGLSASTLIFESSAKPRVAAKAKASTGSTRAAGSFEEEPGNQSRGYSACQQAPFSKMQKDSNSENKPLDMTNNKRLQPLAGDRRAACDQYGYEL